MSIPYSFTKILGQTQWHLTTYQIITLGFAGFILFGAWLLMLPFASKTGEGLCFIDALFTAASAVCVTGLVVVDTGTRFTVFGQLVIIMLIQVGGLGVMTVATLFVVLSGKRINLRERLLIQEATNQFDLAGVVRLVIYVIKATVLIEFIGGSILAVRFYQDFGSLGIYYGYWHAVSSFCNAGFDLLGNYKSLTAYVEDVTINLTVAGLIIIGGIGFPVIADIVHFPSSRRLSLHSKIVLATTLVLIFSGTVFLFMGEYANERTMGELTTGGKVLASFFQSVSARTAGYNSIDIGAMKDGSIIILVILMFIGASPCSMGGGIKTSTFAVLTASLAASVTGRKDPCLFHRTIPQQVVYKAFTVVMISLGLVIIVTLVMTFTESFSALQILFDVVSSFGTVGLTTGITPYLTSFGKAGLILTMFVGRVGTMTLLMSLALKSRKSLLRYPDGKVIIG
ncbi:MAG: TrkH family potassium uptake protein [Veillonellales bacterium]